MKSRNRTVIQLSAFLCMAPVFIAAGAQSPLPSLAPRLRIGVMDLSGTALSMQTTATPTTTTTTVALAAPAEFARGLTQILTTALSSYGDFIVLERAQLEKILAEQSLGRSGAVEPQSAAAAGRLLGAQALITGDITEFKYNQSSAGGKLSILKSVDKKLGGKLDRVSAQVALDLRIIDVATSAVIGSARGEGKASATGAGVDFSKTDREIALGGTKTTPLGAASRDAIENAVKNLVAQLRKVPWQGRVADVRGARIYINAGSEIGIRTGMRFDLFSPEEAIVDPESGATLGASDNKSGQITIIEVSPKFAVGKLSDGAVPKRNDIVRFSTSASAR